MMSEKMKSFGVGAFAAMSATICTHPLDVIKVRKQLCRNISYSGLTNGLPDALKRQIIYSGIRFGLYDILGSDRTLLFYEKMLKGAFVGAVGATVATPFDLAKVRKQALTTHSPKSILAHWQGGGPTIARAAIVTSSQLSSYYHALEWFQSHGYPETDQTKISASVFAGIVTSFVSNPLDVMKTWRMTDRIQTPQIQSLAHIIRREGVLSLYRGLGPTLFRMCPYVIILFTMRDYLQKSL